MLVKHKQVSKRDCGYSKRAPKQPDLSRWARGHPGLSPNPRHSASPGNHPLGRTCKCHILDMNGNNLDHQSIVYFVFMWECYKSGDSFLFSFCLCWMAFSQQVESADSSNVSSIASNTQILTSMPDQLTTQNISAAANIAVQILKKPNVSEDSQVRLIKIKIRFFGLIFGISILSPLYQQNEHSPFS